MKQEEIRDFWNREPNKFWKVVKHIFLGVAILTGLGGIFALFLLGKEEIIIVSAVLCIITAWIALAIDDFYY